MHITKQQIDWATGILNTVVDGGEVFGDDVAKATSLLTAVAYSAVSMDKVWVVMFNDRRTGDFGVDKVFLSHEAALRYAIPKMTSISGQAAGDVMALETEELASRYSELTSELEAMDDASPFGVEQVWIVEKTLTQ